MAMQITQPFGLGTRLGSRSNVRSAVRIGSSACINPRTLGSSRSRELILRAAAPEVETTEEVAEFSEVGYAFRQSTST